MDIVFNRKKKNRNDQKGHQLRNYLKFDATIQLKFCVFVYARSISTEMKNRVKQYILKCKTKMQRIGSMILLCKVFLDILEGLKSSHSRMACFFFFKVVIELVR